MIEIIEDSTGIEWYVGARSTLVDYIIRIADAASRCYGLCLTQRARGDGPQFYWVTIPAGASELVAVSIQAGHNRAWSVGTVEVPLRAPERFDPDAVAQALEDMIVPQLERHGGHICPDD